VERNRREPRKTRDNLSEIVIMPPWYNFGTDYLPLSILQYSLIFILLANRPFNSG
jgi:hypothetical protein